MEREANFLEAFREDFGDKVNVWDGPSLYPLYTAGTRNESVLAEEYVLCLGPPSAVNLSTSTKSEDIVVELLNGVVYDLRRERLVSRHHVGSGQRNVAW